MTATTNNTTTKTKTITVINDGGVYDISSKEEFKDLLSSLKTNYLEHVDTKRRVLGFLSVVDGGTYTFSSSHYTASIITPKRAADKTDDVSMQQESAAASALASSSRDLPSPQKLRLDESNNHESSTNEESKERNGIRTDDDEDNIRSKVVAPESSSATVSHMERQQDESHQSPPQAQPQPIMSDKHRNKTTGNAQHDNIIIHTNGDDNIWKYSLGHDTQKAKDPSSQGVQEPANKDCENNTGDSKNASSNKTEQKQSPFDIQLPTPDTVVKNHQQQQGDNSDDRKVLVEKTNDAALLMALRNDDCFTTSNNENNHHQGDENSQSPNNRRQNDGNQTENNSSGDFTEKDDDDSIANDQATATTTIAAAVHSPNHKRPRNIVTPKESLASPCLARKTEKSSFFSTSRTQADKDECFSSPPPKQKRLRLDPNKEDEIESGASLSPASSTVSSSSSSSSLSNVPPTKPQKTTQTPTLKKTFTLTEYLVEAKALLDKHKYRQAMMLYEKALPLQIKALGKNHTKVANTCFQMGRALRHLGIYGEAMRLHQRALQIRLQCLPSNDSRIADSYNTIAAVLTNQGRYDPAMHAYQKALHIRLEVYGDKHAYVAQVLSNMGWVLQTQKKYVEARKKYEAALDIYLEVHGEGHARVEITRQQIAESNGKLNAAAATASPPPCTVVL
ncbi:unnamed protein product [Cylindrotheca closterium]|uniref:Kinesin light chain n=1 Tax=Cylindrotheca closterium TaxID=2856 RepID=A0AAD2CJC9_9STRA|nr:unnamed protein product [Cylindrotheca closterium]